MVSEMHRAVVAVRDHPASRVALDDLRWRALVAEVEAHRTIGYLAWGVADGRVVATDEQRAWLFERHASLMRHALIIEQETRQLVADVGADRLVLFKGVAASHLDHRRPSLRVFQDVDALVPAPHLEAVIHRMAAAGAHRDLPPRASDWDVRFAKDITFVAGSGAEVDLHRTLVPGPFGFAIDLDQLVERTVTFDLGGTEVRALAPEGRVLSSALALTAGEPTPRLAAALDMAGALASGAALDEVVRLAERWRIGSLLAEATSWSHEQLGDDVIPSALVEWAAQRPIAAWERRWRRLYESSGGTNTLTLLSAPLGMARWRDRAAYLRGLLRPSADYRSARDRSARPREWRTGLSELMRGSRP